MKDLLDQLASIWTGGSPTQRALAVLSAVVVALGVGSSVYLSTRPDFALLFGNLEPSDAAEVVERVRGAGVEARVEDGGRSVYVPREQVAEIRMVVSAAGLPRGGARGWELFDDSAFGVSEFVQNVNLRRALEGELARSIRSFDAIDDATVKISAPRRSPFVGDERKAKASVVIDPRAGRQIGLENVRAIEHLVSGAVEGLEIDQVRVLDTRGRVLSQTHEDPLAAAASTQMDYRLKREAERRRTAQEMLDRMGVVADVRVALELDFQQVSETSEKFDPTGTVLSETLDNSSTRPATVSNGGPAGAEAKIDGESLPSSASALTEETKETITSTYGVGKTVRSQQRLAPEVRRISVSLVVQKEFEDRMAEIVDQVKAAVGFVEGRDVVKSMAHDFKLPEAEEVVETAPESTLVRDVAERGIQLLGILGALYLVLRILKTIERRERPATPAAPAAEATASAGETARPAAAAAADAAPLESPRVEDLVRQSVERDPAAAARVLRGWLHEGDPN
ncbi:MAG: flagellar basal-body MS-ring/collar protein FliF [Planctomycetota bacterium JB042]